MTLYHLDFGNVLRTKLALLSKRKLHVFYLVLAIISMLLGGIAHVRAEEPGREAQAMSDPSSTPRALRTEQSTLREEQQNRFINLVRNAYGRMDAAILRLENITSRLEARIELVKSTGADTSRAGVPLIKAKEKLTEARSLLEKAKSSAESAILSDSPRGAFGPARDDFRAAKQAIREAFVLIQEALAELKDSTLAYEINRRNLGSVPESLPHSAD